MSYCLPFEPLEALARVAAFESYGVSIDARLIDVLGCSGRAVREWRVKGVPFWNADRTANRLGLHPLEVWGDEWLDVLWRINASWEARISGSRPALSAR